MEIWGHWMQEMFSRKSPVIPVAVGVPLSHHLPAKKQKYFLPPRFYRGILNLFKETNKNNRER